MERTNTWVQSLGSGSSGNAYLVVHQGRAVLVDAGIGATSMTQELAARGLGWDRIEAVLVSHEHVDHVRALPAIRRRRLPVLASEGTARALGLDHTGYERLTAGREIPVADLSVLPISTSHDAAEPLGFRLQLGSSVVVVITDLGVAPSSLCEIVGDADLLVVEANHDVGMLRSGPYPAHLKRRVLSERGHLSNRDCGALLEGALRTTTRPRTIWLAHLSATNNQPAIAAAAAHQSLAGGGCLHAVTALPRSKPGPVWTPASRQFVAQMPLFPPEP